MSDQWLTFVELGTRLGCSPDAARMYANRRGWERRSPNRRGTPVRVLVPEHVDLNGCAPDVVERVAEQANGFERTHEVLAEALAVAHEQLRIANDRAARAERQFDGVAERFAEQTRLLDQLWTALADAQAAERIANTEATGLRGELDRRRTWSLPRRLAWAWGER